MQGASNTCGEGELRDDNIKGANKGIPSIKASKAELSVFTPDQDAMRLMSFMKDARQKGVVYLE